MQAELGHIRWNRLAASGDSFGVSCDDEGPSIGPIRLLKRNASGLEPQGAKETGPFSLRHYGLKGTRDGD